MYRMLDRRRPDRATQSRLDDEQTRFIAVLFRSVSSSRLYRLTIGAARSPVARHFVAMRGIRGRDDTRRDHRVEPRSVLYYPSGLVITLPDRADCVALTSHPWNSLTRTDGLIGARSVTSHEHEPCHPGTPEWHSPANL